VPLDEHHLVVRSMLATFAAMDVSPPGLQLSCTNRIPHSRGLGSSSAAIVGGIVLARSLVEGGAVAFDDAAALSLASLIEGHPDNVAPALLGGFVISGRTAEEVWAQQSPVDPSISAVVFVPPHGVRTDVARGLLPATVPHADAAANTGRAALLVAALGGHPQQLWRATEDFLHQQQRLPAMPESLALVAELRGRRVPAVVSGAGPTVLAFVTDDAEGVAALAPTGWRVMPQGVGGHGAVVLM
jgi:homoserine kinase